MKHVVRIFRLATVAALALICLQQARAQSTNTLQSYRFIPSRSTLEVTGGVAGIEQYFAYGSFRLVANAANPAFVDVQSWLVRDSQSPYQWTDQKLNLSGLDGAISPSDPNHLVFQGVDGQNQPFTLTAVQHGRLMHLVGENDPGCCGMLTYRFDALAYNAPYADFNLDGIVDGSDRNALMANMGTFAHAIFEQGDADGDGDVDGSDFLTWQREIGDAIAMSEFAEVAFAGFAGGSIAVPEPRGVMLAIMYIALFLKRYRR
jgi:hypothetical protein